MTQNKTSLILNNLVELSIPTATNSCFMTFPEEDIPFTGKNSANKILTLILLF